VIPATLDGWSLDVVRDLLAKGYQEGDRFDFKEMLPRDDVGRLRLSKTCCAFANSQGGYLVFGVVDAKGSVEQRLVGVDPTIDFPGQFGDYPRRCVPSVEWAPKNPPVQLSNGRVLPIVHVPPSPSAPHAVREQSGAWFFAKRTAQGNQPMTIEEVRAEFLGFYEKRVKLQLLRTELERMQHKAGQMVVSGSRLTEQPPMRRSMPLFWSRSCPTRTRSWHAVRTY
jgi:predicted HTH transcriptional regulator